MGEADVPAVPKVREVAGKVWLLEIGSEFDAEKRADSSHNPGVTGEIVV